MFDRPPFDILLARWEALGGRERVAVAAAALVATVAILFLAVIEPVLATRDTLRAEVSALSDDAAWMRDAAVRISPTPVNSTGDGSLLSTVDASAQRAGLRAAVRRLQSDGSDGVRITLDDAAFDAIVLMLGELRDSGVRVERMTLRRDAAGDGLVDGSLSLRSGA